MFTGINTILRTRIDPTNYLRYDNVVNRNIFTIWWKA